MFNKIETDIEDINVRMNSIKHKLLVLSGKGGKLYIFFKEFKIISVFKNF